MRPTLTATYPKNPERGVRSGTLAPLVDRLRDVRTRLRLGLAPGEDLDALLDQAARSLESAAEDVDSLASMAWTPVAKYLAEETP